MSNNDRNKLTEFEKSLIGRVCCNCGSTEDIQYHHIVPLALGGRDIISNMCCLCYDCHQLIHFGENKNINHSKATKVGQQMAYLNGKQIGNIKGTKLTTKKSVIAKEQIVKYSKDFNGTLNDVEVMKLIGIARNTYYKYKRELLGEV